MNLEQEEAHPGASRLTPAPARLHFVDWLRVFLVVSVIADHVMYVLSDGFFPMYGPWLPPDDITRRVSFVFLFFNQAYFMALFFFLCGYFVTPSFERKGASRYLQDRAVRLLIPVAVYELLLMPLNCAIAQGMTSPNNPPGLAAAPSAFAWWFQALREIGIGRNPMWFTITLFIFELLYSAFRAALRAASPGADARLFARSVTAPEALKPYSARRTVSTLAVFAVGIIALHFPIRLVGRVTDWQPFPFFQMAYFVQYCVAFVLGNAAYVTQVYLCL